MSEWRPASFRIATVGEDATVRGIACGPFGIFRDDTLSAFPWSVTHLASGWNCGHFDSRETARAFAEEITPLADWGGVTPADQERIMALCRPAYTHRPGHRPMIGEPSPACAAADGRREENWW